MYDPGVFLYKTYDFCAKQKPKIAGHTFCSLTNIKTYKNSIINTQKKLSLSNLVVVQYNCLH